jgi:two-component system, chemotaxis family, CheB/CheR fusion protein
LAKKQSPQVSAPPVVGIGASAGGLEALQAFFQAVPADLGLAYVVIVHLAPDRKSDLPGILKRYTPMPVTQVGDHDKASLEADHVYVIAPNRKLEITDTGVGSSRFEQPRGQRAAIDLFFRSLAANHGDGFAVVLSGSGSDGAMGARAVKEAGGLVLVQDPKEADHDGMPRAVISTGTADVVLPVRELAARLAELVRAKSRISHLANSEPRIEQDEEAGLSSVLDLLKARTGHDFSRYKRNTVVRRLARRMQLQHKSSIDEYREYLQENLEEVQALFNDLLISVTSFFRDPEAWEALRQEAIGPLIEQVSADEQIRVWVPGCATGEEAYTMAMLLYDEMRARHIQHDFIIFGSDVDETALARAREGRYPAAIAADVSEERLERYFRREDEEHFRVTGLLRDCVVFATHNVLRDPPFSRLHLLACRNLLIYLDRELQEQLMGVFRYACRNEAYIFLGVSESVDEELFRAVNKHYRIYQARPRRERSRRELPELMAAPRAVSRRDAWGRAALSRKEAESHAEALEHMAPPSVLVDERWNVLHFSESVGRFLQQPGGAPTRALNDLVRRELQDEVHNVLHRAFEGHAAKLSAFVPVHYESTWRRVAVLAQWRPPGEGDGASALVTFLDGGEATGEEPGAGQEPASELVRELREKLRHAERRSDHLRDDQHLATEDLRAANEELQSLNEEYRSTTEELETSKEELQSINEELQTVNQELKAKLEEVTHAHSDMKNLMAATNIPILFLDRDLAINRFTPQLSEIFSIRSRDMGRPIADFTHRLNYETFAEDARRVLTDLAPVEREATSRDGRGFIVRFRPYRTAEDTIDGVVVTFVDVTELKRTEAVLRESEARFRALVEASSQIVWTADARGSFAEDSPSWREFTGQEAEASRGWGWLDAVHPEDRDSVAFLWQQALAGGSRFAAEFRLRHMPSNAYRWTSVRAVPLPTPAGKLRGWVGMNIDITAWREAVEALRQADLRKDEFLAMFGHELRNPLAAIRSTLEALGTHGEDGGELAEWAWGVIDRQSRHMHRLVNDLLDVERIKLGKLQLSREPIEVGRCILDAAEALRGQIKQAGLQLQLELDEAGLTVDGDPERVVQMVDNLLRNSINHTDRGGRITVRARRERGRAVISVQDTGVGIDPAEVERLFEPYYQGAQDKLAKGLGLGLTLVRRLVEMHGGTIEVHSQGKGTGATFTLSLPLAASARAGPPVPDIAPGASLRILVVDDQADIADSFGAVLQGQGNEVKVAHSGEAALELARKLRPQVAFLDLSMPGMDGRELARRLRSDYPPGSLSLVALSGLGEKQVPDTDGLFQHRLLKPAAPDAIMQVLNSVAKSRQPGRGD